jgi:hypothetical protein
VIPYFLSVFYRKAISPDSNGMIPERLERTGITQPIINLVADQLAKVTRKEKTKSILQHLQCEQSTMRVYDH